MPKIARLEITSFEYVLKKGKGYGNARGVNNRRNCSLITLTTDDGVVGIGDAAGPLGVIREYVRLLTPSFVGQSLYDFEIVAAGLRNKLYHFGTHNHFIAALGGINIAVLDAMGKTLGVPVHDLIGGKVSDRLACYATTGYFTDDPKVDIAAQLSTIDPGRFVGAKIKIGAGIASDVERVRAARDVLGDDALLMVDYNGNYTVDVALELDPADRAVPDRLGRGAAATLRHQGLRRAAPTLAGRDLGGRGPLQRARFQAADRRPRHRYRAAAADRRRRLRRDEGGGALGANEQPAGLAAVLG